MSQWIGLRGKLQETSIFYGKNRWFNQQIFPLTNPMKVSSVAFQVDFPHLEASPSISLLFRHARHCWMDLIEVLVTRAKTHAAHGQNKTRWRDNKYIYIYYIIYIDVYIIQRTIWEYHGSPQHDHPGGATDPPFPCFSTCPLNGWYVCHQYVVNMGGLLSLFLL